MDENYAFIGLGAMGHPMASCIRLKASASSTLYIYDVNPSTCATFKTAYESYGPIKIASSAREVAENASVVLSIVPDANDVRNVYLDPEKGVITARKDEDRLMIECSTMGAETTREVGRKMMEEGCGVYVDAPVSCGVPAAQAGTLSLLIGYPPPSPSTPSPVSTRLSHTLSLIGSPQKSFYLHNLGVGLTAKICNNYLSGTILLASAEALAIGVAHGLDPSALYSVIAASTGQNWMLDHVTPIPIVQTALWVPSNSGYRPVFKTQMMLKDLSLGIESAQNVGIRPAMADTALEVWKSAAQDERCVDRDGSSIYLHVGGALPEGYEDMGKRGETGEWTFGEK